MISILVHVNLPQMSLAAASKATVTGGAELLAKDIPLAVAAASAQVGGMVVVFVLFALQARGQENIDEITAPFDPHPVIRRRAAHQLLLRTSSVTMTTLLLTPLFLLYNLAARVVSPSTAVVIGLGSFAFSITTLIVGLSAFFVVSNERLRHPRGVPRSDLEPDADLI